MKPITLPQLVAMKGGPGQIWATAYDAWMAGIIDEAVDVILVGDSLGMMVQGKENTLPVTLDEMIYHAKMVRRRTSHAFLVVDMPFLSYQISIEDAIRSAGRIIKETGAQAVKLEGGQEMAPTIQALTARGIPVVGHVGMTPQSVHVFGGFGKQGKDLEAAQRILEDAKAISLAGCFAMVLENIPHDLAAQITKEVPAITIGIGAGGDTDGQVQVFHDLFGLDEAFTPRHAVQFGQLGKQMKELAQEYALEVRSKRLVSK